jgi:hypothetical protein
MNVIVSSVSAPVASSSVPVALLAKPLPVTVRPIPSVLGGGPANKYWMRFALGVR